MPNDFNIRADQSNLPCDYADLPSPKDLDAMSAVELAEELERIWGSMTEDTYDDAVICAYLDALDRKAPMPEMPDAENAYADFQQILRNALPEAPLQEQSVSPKRPVRLRHLWRTALAAVVAILGLLAGMVTAQAAGIDVFGAMAHWTEEVFSFGKIRDDGANDDLSANKDGIGEEMQPTGDLEFNSVQDALDAFGITEVTEPQLPGSFGLTRISVTNVVEADIFLLSAGYESDTGEHLGIDIMRYSAEPSVQVEKNDTSVETFEINGVTVFLVENSVNYTLAWLTEHYECYISGADQHVLREIVNSMEK